MRILLYSGGLDSLIAWYYLDKPKALYVDLSHRYAFKELDCLSKLPIPYGVINTNWGTFELPSAHIPARNLILGLYAAAEGGDIIYLVAQKGEQTVPDRTPTFFAETSKILSFHFEREIVFSNPFPHMTKTEMVRWYLDYDLPVDDLLKSVSCYSEQDGHCGKCSSCFRKFVSLTVNGIECRQIYSNDIVEWGRQHYANKLEQYPEYRQEDIRKVLGL